MARTIQKWSLQGIHSGLERHHWATKEQKHRQTQLKGPQTIGAAKVDEESLIKNDLTGQFYSNNISTETSASGFSWSFSGNCTHFLPSENWMKQGEIREEVLKKQFSSLSSVILQTRAIFTWKPIENLSLSLRLILEITLYTI